VNDYEINNVNDGERNNVSDDIVKTRGEMSEEDKSICVKINGKMSE